MTVVPFRARVPKNARAQMNAWAPKNAWAARELAALVSACEGCGGQGSGWETGLTEAGDPQFYVLAAESTTGCRVSISRLGGLYVVESGDGTLLAESGSIEAVASLLASAFRPRRGAALAGRLLVALAALLSAIEQRTLPVLIDTEDLWLRVTPHLAG